MAHPLIDRSFYESIVHFDESDEAQDYYYKVMDTEVVRKGGKKDTVRNLILKVYAMLFCDDLGVSAGHIARPEDVEATADRLFTGRVSFDPGHWYRMKYHFPVIDEDNYDRFAALVISDLKAGPLRDAEAEGGDILLVGELDPLHMTKEQRKNQRIRRLDVGGKFNDDTHRGRSSGVS